MGAAQALSVSAGAQLVAGVGLVAVAGAAAACGAALGPGTQRLGAPELQIAWRAEPQPIPVSRHFALEIELCPPAGQPLPTELRVDATMPEHRHGMNYKPSLSAIGPGHWRAEGLLFHMPGRWQLVFEWRDAGGALQRLAQRVDVE